MMPPPECYQCVHLEPDGSDESRICAAFPKGIPERILYGIQRNPEVTDVFVRELHHTPTPEQTNDLVFKPSTSI